MGNNLTINFSNFAPVASFSRDENGYTIQEGVGQINQWPGDYLQNNGGFESCAASQDLSKLADGDANIYCCWNYDGWRFGVKIIAPTQVLGMGDRPYWQIMYDQTPDNPNINWINSGSNPAYQYEWPTNLGLKIVGTPTSDHSALSINVVVSSLSEVAASDRPRIRRGLTVPGPAEPLSLYCFGAPGQVGGGWQASIPNTDITYNFAGDTLQDQLATVNEFATAMNDGVDAVNGMILDTFVDVPADIGAEELTNMMFASTGSLWLSGGEVYLAPEEAALIEYITSAGAELLAALALL